MKTIVAALKKHLVNSMLEAMRMGGNNCEIESVTLLFILFAL